MAEISTEQLLQELTNLRESNEQRQDSLIDFLYGNNGVAMESLGDLPRIFLEEGEKNRQSLAEEITNSLTTLSKDFNGVSLSILETQINNTNLLKTSIDKQIASIENQSVMIGLLSSVLEKDIEVNPLIQPNSESSQISIDNQIQSLQNQSVMIGLLSSVLEKDIEVNPLIEVDSGSSQIVDRLDDATNLLKTSIDKQFASIENQSVMIGLLSSVLEKDTEVNPLIQVDSGSSQIVDQLAEANLNLIEIWNTYDQFAGQSIDNQFASIENQSVMIGLLSSVLEKDIEVNPLIQLDSESSQIVEQLNEANLSLIDIWNTNNQFASESIENQSVMIGLLSSVLEKDIEVNPLIQLDSELSSVLEKDTEVNPLIQPNSESSQISIDNQIQSLQNQSVMIGLLSSVLEKDIEVNPLIQLDSESSQISIDNQIQSLQNQSVMINLLSSVLEKDIEVNPLIQLDSESSSVLEKDTEVNPLIQPNSESSQIVEQLNEANLSLIDIWNTNDQLAGQTLANQSVMVGLLSDIDKKLEKPDDFDMSLSRAGGKTGTGIEVSTMDGGDSGEVLSSIGGAVAEFGDKKTKSGADGLLAVSGALIATAGALVIFNYVEWGSLVKAGLALGGLIATLHLVDKKTISGAKALAIAGASLAIAAGGLILFNYVDFSSVIEGSIAIGVLTFALSKIPKTSIFGAKALAIAGASLAIAAGGLMLFNDVDFSSVIEGSIAIGVLTFALSKIPTNAIAGAGALAIMGGALAIAAIGFKVMSEIPPESWGSVIIGAGALTVFGIAMAALGAGPQAAAVAAGAGALIVMGAGMAVSAFGLKMFSEIKPDSWSNIMAGALPLLAIGGTVAALGLVAMPIALGSAALSAMGVSFLVATSGLQRFSEIEPDSWSNIMAGALPLMAIGGAMAVLGAASILIIPGSVALTVMGGSFLLAASGLQTFSEVNWEGVGEGAGNLALIGATVSGLGLAIIPISLGVLSLNMMSKAIGNFAKAVQPLLAKDLSSLSNVKQAFIDLNSAFEKLPNPISMKWKMSSLSMMGNAMRTIATPLYTLGKTNWSNLNMVKDNLKGILSTFANVGNDIDEDDFEVFEDIGEYLEPFTRTFSNLGKIDISGFLDSINSIGNIEINPANLEKARKIIRDFMYSLEGGDGVDISKVGPHMSGLADGISSLSNISNVDNIRKLASPIADVLDAIDDQSDGTDISKIGPHLVDLADGIFALSIIDSSGLKKLHSPLRNILDAIDDQADGTDLSKMGPHLEKFADGIFALSIIDANGLDAISSPLENVLSSLGTTESLNFKNVDSSKLKSISDFAQILSGVDGSNLEIVSKALSEIDFPMITIKHQLDKNSGQMAQDEKISSALDTIISLLTNGNTKSDEITEALDTIAKINKDGMQQTDTTIIDASRDYPGALQTADKAFI